MVKIAARIKRKVSIPDWWDSLVRQLCGTEDLLDAKIEQVRAPPAFVSNLEGALLAIEPLRADAGGLEKYGQNYLNLSP